MRHMLSFCSTLTATVYPFPCWRRNLQISLACCGTLHYDGSSLWFCGKTMGQSALDLTAKPVSSFCILDGRVRALEVNLSWKEQLRIVQGLIARFIIHLESNSSRANSCGDLGLEVELYHEQQFGNRLFLSC
jgi:hypothetical protein